MLTIRDFLMPDLGEGLTEGEINRWLVAEGDVVVVDQPIAEITTEKAVVEVPTPFAGRVATLHGAAGETITVGKPLISIEVAGAPAEGASGNVLVGYGTSEAAPRARRSAPRGRRDPPRTRRLRCRRLRRWCADRRPSWASTSARSPAAGRAAW